MDGEYGVTDFELEELLAYFWRKDPIFSEE